MVKFQQKNLIIRNKMILKENTFWVNNEKFDIV